MHIKLITALLVIVLLLSAIACGKGTGSQPTPTPTATSAATQTSYIDYSTIGPLSIEACCNVELVITDPNGLKISGDTDIDGVRYTYKGHYSGSYFGEYGGYVYGEPTEVEVLLGCKPGNYSIEVIPEAWACNDDTFTLTVSPWDYSVGYVPIVIVEDFPISELTQPFIYQCKQRIPTTVTYAGEMSCKQYDTIDLSATLVDINGNPVGGKTIGFHIGGQSVTAITDSDGRAVTELTLNQEPSEWYYIDVGFNGDLDYSPSYNAYTFEILPPSGGKGPTEEYSWDTYTWDKDGLASDIVYAVAVDDDGNKWFGTEAGVSMFDGKKWFTYDESDGLAGNVVYDIAIDSNGNKWFATSTETRMFGFGGNGSGVTRFGGSSWATYTSRDGLADDYVTDIKSDADGNVWFATANGVSKFDGTAWTTYTSEDGLASNMVITTEIDSEGNKWFGTDSGVSKFDGSTWTTYTYSDCLAGNVVTSIAIDEKGDEWFATNFGISHFNGTKWVKYNPEVISVPAVLEGELVVPSVIDIEIDTDGTVWIVTFSACSGGAWGGVSKFDGINWSYYIAGEGSSWLSCNYIWDIEIDEGSNKWLGTDNGVIKFK